MEERDGYTESRPINNSEAVQEAKACVEVEVFTCLSNEQMPSVPDYQESGITPDYTHQTGGSDEENLEVQQKMEEENKEPGLRNALHELSEKCNQAISTHQIGGSDEELEVQQKVEEENKELGLRDALHELSEKSNQTISTHQIGGSDEEKPVVQQNMEEENKQNMEEENKELDLGDALSEISEKNNQANSIHQTGGSNEEKRGVQLYMEESNKQCMEESNKQNIEEANKQNMEEDNKELGLGDAVSELSEKCNHAISTHQTGGLDEEKPRVQHYMDEANKHNMELGLGDALSELSEKSNQAISNLANNDQVEAGNLLSNDKDTERLILPIEVETTDLLNECSEPPMEDDIKSYIEQMNPSIEDLTPNTSIQNLEMVPSSSQQSDHKDRRISKSRKKNLLKSPVSTDRVLRSRTQEKSKDSEPSIDLKSKDSEPSNDLNNVTAVEERKRKRKKRSIKGEGARVDEFSSIRKHLRYLMNRINYEQNLIEAYSSEGWKGFSSDKLKPEKELQRASNEIMRRKLKIRDLFQRIDALCREGRLSESLFDSEGQIDSEDIFCAKCGSDELSLENDIILCDGVCDRGFHQFCLEPPLLKTDIPPDDEGWLCPGCDCKDDCMDLLNEFQGSNLSITDGWEKVYPEAAAAAAGQSSDNALGLPSDDSEDGDYDPNVPDVPDAIDQEDESSSEKSSSDQSGYASASEQLEALPNDDQYLGLPSDDSEDEDFDPSAPERVKEVGQESSSSDFTSDSEDLAALGDNGSSKDDNLVSSSINSTIPVRNSNGQSSGCGPSKSALHNELSSILESGLDMDGLEPVSGRRHVERLDYKKLHDETYGNVHTDSSDDTYGSDSMDSSDDRGHGRSTRKRSSKNPVPALSKNGTNNLKNKKTKRSSKITCQKPVAENTDNSVARTPDNTLKSSSSVRRTTSSSHRRLSQHALERLLASFQENQYPERATKESLAEELRLSPKQVSKWFENTRWSTRHPSSEANKAKSASRTGIQSSQTSGKLPKPEQESGACFRDNDSNGAQHQESPKPISVVFPCQSGDAGDDKLANPKIKRPESTSGKSRKRKGRPDHTASRSKDRKESQKPPAKSRKVSETQTVDKARTRRRKSI